MRIAGSSNMAFYVVLVFAVLQAITGACQIEVKPGKILRGKNTPLFVKSSSTFLTGAITSILVGDEAFPVTWHVTTSCPGKEDNNQLHTLHLWVK